MTGKISGNLGRSSGLIKAVSAGRAGTVDWDTTPKTGTVTAATGEGYFVNTTAGAITVNLPAGAAGSIVSLADYAATWQTNNVTVSPNGSEKIGAVAEDAVLNTEGQSVTFVYVDSTQGWVNTMDSTSNVRGNPPYIVATGGTITTVCTNYKVHTFTGPGTFCVSNAGGPGGSNTVSYMVVAGGGGGTNDRGGGGGAGGYREGRTPQCASYTASPLNAPAGLPVSVQGYPIVIGGGGTSPPSPGCGTKGSDSSFSTITSTGGGLGLNDKAATPSCGPGGSGGGGGKGPAVPNTGGAGNTPPVSPAQGFPGGTGLGTSGGAGGGGATVVGGNPAHPGSGCGGVGGAGATSSINATPTARAGGGGGSSDGSPVAGGTGGGGTGHGGPPGSGGAGTVNTGGGGGGSRSATTGTGGSGIAIIRYKFQ